MFLRSKCKKSIKGKYNLHQNSDGNENLYAVMEMRRTDPKFFKIVKNSV